MAEPHQYRIAAKNPAAHLFEVGVTVAEPDPAGQAFTFPAWIPGSYMIRDLARNVVSARATSEDRDVALEKLDKSTWQAAPCDAPLTLILEIYAGDESVRGAHLDTTHAFFDGACVFPAVVGQENAECRLHIEAPDKPHGGEWRVATSLRPLDAEPYSYGKYTAADYAELIDHPVEAGDLLIGEFDVDGIPHAIAVRGDTRFDMARLCHDLAKLCSAQVAFLGRPDNFDRYLFLLAVREKAYGGLEHRWSSSLTCSRMDLPRKGATKISDNYRRLLGLCSHEYFHLWNVKRMKPARFHPFDLRAETHTGLLWVFEGITSYYDDVFLVRSGLINEESYLDLLARTITRVLRARGRKRQSVEESSFDAWTRFYKQDANSSNAIVSYYTKGALIALALDLTLRRETDGKTTLDDVMRECWQRYGESGEGMPERGLESVAQEVSGLELGSFFERYVRGTVDPPLERLLRVVGVAMHLRPATDSRDAGGKPAPKDWEPLPWLGATMADNGARDAFGVVHNDSPAERAGLSPGDEPVAIDGRRLTASNLDERLRDFKRGDSVTLTVFRDDKLMALKVRLGKPPEDTCYLTIDAEADAAAEEERGRWLSS